MGNSKGTYHPCTKNYSDLPVKSLVSLGKERQKGLIVSVIPTSLSSPQPKRGM